MIRRSKIIFAAIGAAVVVVIVLQVAGIPPFSTSNTDETRRMAARLADLAATTDPDDADARWLLNVAYMAIGKYPDEVPAQWLIPPDRLASVEDPGRFYNVASLVGLDTRNGAGGVVVDDLDGDHDLDLLLSGMGLREQTRFFRNDGPAGFTERTAEAGLTGIVGGLNLIHADFDNDGDQDIYANLGGAYEADSFANALFANPGHGNAWVTLKLQGRQANRSAIGATCGGCSIGARPSTWIINPELYSL